MISKKTVYQLVGRILLVPMIAVYAVVMVIGLSIAIFHKVFNP